MESKESRAANITRVIFSILLFFNFACIINCALVKFYVINPDYWKTLFVEDMAIQLTKDHDIYMDRLLYDRENLEMEFDEERDREYIERSFEEYFEVLENGDTTIGDWFDEMFEEVDEDKLDYTRDKMENDLDRFYDELEESKYFMIMDKVNMVTVIMLISSIVNSGIMIAITTVLHRNKWRVVKAAGISAAIAGSVSLILWVIIRNIVSTATLDDVYTEIEQSIYDSLMHSLMMLIMICLAAACVGIGIAIIGGINASAKNRDIEDGYDGGYE